MLARSGFEICGGLSGISPGESGHAFASLLVAVAATSPAGKHALNSLGSQLLYSLAPVRTWSYGWARQLEWNPLQSLTSLGMSYRSTSVSFGRDSRAKIWP